MNDPEPKSDRLLDEAIDLVIRMQCDPDNPVSLEMIRNWRTRGPEHEKIWSQVSLAHGMSGKILSDRQKAERRAKLGLTRRNFLIGGAVGLGGIGSYLIPDAMIWARADQITAKGEIRRVRLPDESVATLGPDSAIAMNYDPSQRRIELLKGMSFFEVEKDTRRPFLVQAGGITSMALGTAFDISDDAGTLTVSVDHGLVDVRATDGSPAAGEQLGAGDWMMFDSSSRSIDHGKREPGQIALWRDKLIVAEREPVASLIARIGRWFDGRIVLADPYIGAKKVSGLFDLHDPLKALEAVVHPAGGYVRQISSFLTVISPL